VGTSERPIFFLSSLYLYLIKAVSKLPMIGLDGCKDSLYSAILQMSKSEVLKRKKPFLQKIAKDCKTFA
jgi:hypothetical protein